MEDQDKTAKRQAEEKDELSQEEIKKGLKNFAEGSRPHAALETPDGKNNGAEPAVFHNQRKGRT
jgi:hypothetical protein